MQTFSIVTTFEMHYLFSKIESDISKTYLKTVNKLNAGVYHLWLLECSLLVEMAQVEGSRVWLPLHFYVFGSPGIGIGRN